MKKLPVMCCGMLLLLPLPAWAYIDPGTGSAIMSAIIGCCVAAGVAVRAYWYKLKSFFSAKKPAAGPDEGASTNVNRDSD